METAAVHAGRPIAPSSGVSDPISGWISALREGNADERAIFEGLEKFILVDRTQVLMGVAECISLFNQEELDTTKTTRLVQKVFECADSEIRDLRSRVCLLRCLNGISRKYHSEKSNRFVALTLSDLLCSDEELGAEDYQVLLGAGGRLVSSHTADVSNLWNSIFKTDVCSLSSRGLSHFVLVLGAVSPRGKVPTHETMLSRLAERIRDCDGSQDLVPLLLGLGEVSLTEGALPFQRDFLRLTSRYRTPPYETQGDFVVVETILHFIRGIGWNSLSKSERNELLGSLKKLWDGLAIRLRPGCGSLCYRVICLLGNTSFGDADLKGLDIIPFLSLVTFDVIADVRSWPNILDHLEKIGCKVRSPVVSLDAT